MGTEFESSYTDARDLLKRTSGVHSKLMEQSEGGEEGATNVPKK
jgi:hypothetical protein